jgi:hypothetical protein
MTAPDWSQVDFYAVLGVPADASANDISRAFRRCARDCHPDTHPDDAAATERFLAVVAAHDVLSDEVTRREYDVFRRFGAGSLERADVLSSGVRGYVYAAPAPPPPPASVPRQRHRRWWVVGAMATAAALVGVVIIGTSGSNRNASLPTSAAVTAIAPLTTVASDAPNGFAYSFSNIDCGPGGWSGIFTNADSVAFTGELSAVAMQGDEVVARDVVTQATPVPPGGQRQVQFAWEGAVPPPGSQCQIESVTQG